MSNKFDIPEIPLELVNETRRRFRKVWALEDLNLHEPILGVNWEREPDELMTAGSSWSKRIHDPELDVRYQLECVRQEIEQMEACAEIGVAWNNPGINLVHFGTGPLATAFGSEWIVREDSYPFFEAAVHTPEEALALKKPDLYKDGILPIILDRIDYYNDITEGKIPLTPCDTAGPWSIATQIWHYEDMLEAICTAPEAIHYLLDLVTECIIEWYDIQETRIRRWSGSHVSFGWPWYSRGIGIGDDCMVSVSPKTWEEFFLPYNDGLAKQYGGIFYHCCMCYDPYFESIIKSYNFMGLDADINYNSFDKIESALSGRGVWTRNLPVDYSDTEKANEYVGYIKRLKGKAGMFISTVGKSRQDAIDNGKRLLDSIA